METRFSTLQRKVDGYRHPCDRAEGARQLADASRRISSTQGDLKTLRTML